jgi:allantoin racemase
MKVLIINPNTSTEMTRTIDDMAKKYASPGTEITTVQPPDGPAFMSNAYHSAIQAPKVLDILEKNKNNYDYFILACGLDPGLDACRVVVKNIIGMGEAAIMTACSVASRFSFLGSTPETVTAVPARVRSLGIDAHRLASARPVGTSDEIVKNRKEKLDVYVKVGKQCIEDGASALILSCAGMSDIKEHLERELKVPVIAGAIAALKIAEQFTGLSRT